MRASPIQTSLVVVRSLMWITLALSPGFLLEPSFVIDRLFPVATSSLDVAPSVDFGELRPAEKRSHDVSVQNLAWRPIHLQSPKVDCGCLTIDEFPTELAAYESARGRISIIAPTVGGEFSRNLLVTPKGDEGPVWNIRATGTVIAKVWSEPNQVEFNWEHPTEAAEIRLRSAKGFHIDRAVPSSSSLIEVLDSTRQDGELEIRVRLNVQSSDLPLAGDSSLDVFLDSDQDRPSLRVPIRWAPIPKIGFVPNKIELPAFGKESGEGGRIRRVLAIVVPPNRSAEETQLEVLVPWAQIAQKSIVGSALRLDIEFSTAIMPSEFSQAILATHFPGESVPEKLVASGRHG